VADEFGDGDEVFAAVDEWGDEGVSSGVGGDRVIEAGGLADGGEHGGGGAGGQPGAAAVEEQSRLP
jgi:hypothetical protein